MMSPIGACGSWRCSSPARVEQRLHPAVRVGIALVRGRARMPPAHGGKHRARHDVRQCREAENIVETVHTGDKDGANIQPISSSSRSTKAADE